MLTFFFFFAMASIVRHLSLDKAMAGTVVAGCMAILVDAEHKGRAPLEQSRRARDCELDKQTKFTVSSSQWRQLERDGFLVLDNFLSTKQIREACDTIALLDSQGEFVPSPNQRDYDDSNEEALVRTDRVYMCRDQDTTSGLYKIRQQLASFARTTADSDFLGFESEQYDSNSLQVPQQMQVSIYKSSDHTTQGTQGDYFTSHLDGSGEDSFLELGLLGYLKSKYIRKRYLTCICYLNENWVEGDGGCLRLHKNGAQEGSFDSHDYIDIPPIAGRLVVFSSLNQWHAVLPTRATRYACSLWLSHNN